MNRLGTAQSHVSLFKVLLHLMAFLLDNQKSYLPRILEPGKKSSKIFHLPSKITGTIMWNSRYPSKRKVKMFVNHNNFEQGGSKVLLGIGTGY